MNETRNTLGAVYCIYENSGFLEESVKRIYPVVEKIVFLVNKNTWCGNTDTGIIQGTFTEIVGLPDPDNKITFIWGTWVDEGGQRNYGLSYLNSIGIAWCLIIDDDELYNTDQLAWAKEQMCPMKQAAYLIYFQIYWRDRETVMNINNWVAVPCLASTVPGKVRFKEKRWIIVYDDTWGTYERNNVVCHHMSYVRTPEKMKRKLATFSHAPDIISGWYETVWLSYKDAKEVPPPAGNDRWFISPISTAPYRLHG